jgi:hypothetical protein
VAVSCYVVVTAFIEGPAIQARAESERAREIEQENSAFCKKFGMAPGTGDFAICRDELMGIRDRERERRNRELALW